MNFEYAKRFIPGGVNSPVRAFGSVGGDPRFLVRGQGAYVWDSEGRRYIDLIASWGPLILGHAHPEVVQAVQETAGKGLSFGAPTLLEVELAELVSKRVQANGVCPVELLRLVSTGTEATMTAIRLARAYTGRDLIVKFSGHYHGHADAFLVDAGSGLATCSLAASAGVTPAVSGDTLVVPYNDRAALQSLFEAYPGRIAGIITEAAAANMGVVSPEAGFNAWLVEMAHSQGSLVIFDEVLTGFRVGPAGFWGLENANASLYTPDIFTFAKVLGGGLPVAAIGGRAAIMELLAPLGPVYQAGTLSGNPVAVKAGITTLRLADALVYSRLDKVAGLLADGVSSALTEAGVVHTVQRAGNLFSIGFIDRPITNYAQAKMQESWRYSAFFHAMLEMGILLPPSVYEAWFVSAAHDDAVVEKILEAFPVAAQAAYRASLPNG